ncbi:hypothetical protein RND71_020765 [Anisodus tanguticus]|uniref:FAF domain-containing protein n=1 Tax=Anisodus tanguticus TaxID=243964 RepID=A0AAE1RX13_9SOLA|nr:hypothetical protein RND71_020765 [Anisodus tanguticus]
MASPIEEEEFKQQGLNSKYNYNNITKRQPKKKLKKEYPPTIPSWRSKFPGDLPWSLSRHYVDGRLILKEQSMDYYEYIETKREKGRLVLNLLVLKNNIKWHDDNDTIQDEITYDDTIDRGEEKKVIQEEIPRDFMKINGEENNISNIKNFSNEDGMISNPSLLVVA